LNKKPRRQPRVSSQAQIEEKLRGENLDEWLELWWATQGGTSNWKLIAAALPFPESKELSVLDLCCGPGDIGRYVTKRFRKAQVHCIDRDPFLLSLCAALNRRAGVVTQTFVRDMWSMDWCEGLPRNYEVVATAAALHWFDIRRLSELFGDVFALLRSGGVFLFAEPASPQPRFADAFERWKAGQTQDLDPANYDPGAWDRFWSRANALLGYDHREELRARPVDRGEIGDRGIPVLEYVAMLQKAGFESIDILRRDSWNVVLSSSKP
jgi:SAM-dependent methyltransferase